MTCEESQGYGPSPKGTCMQPLSATREPPPQLGVLAPPSLRSPAGGGLRPALPTWPLLGVKGSVPTFLCALFLPGAACKGVCRRHRLWPMRWLQGQTGPPALPSLAEGAGGPVWS